MEQENNYQVAFLSECRRDKVPVTIFITNGFQLHGSVTGFDAFVVILDTEGKQQLIYKHAISTIVPHRRLSAAN